MLKAFLYLYDVDDTAGPLTIVRGSHKQKFPGWESKLRWTAEEMKAHGYLEAPKDKLKSWVTPLVEIRTRDAVPVTLSEMSVRAGLGGPMALRMWANLLWN